MEGAYRLSKLVEASSGDVTENHQKCKGFITLVPFIIHPEVV